MEALELYFLGIGGVLLHVLTRLQETILNKGTINKALAWINISISALIVMLFVYARESLEVFYPLTPFTSIVLGYSAQSLAKKLFKIATPKELKKDE